MDERVIEYLMDNKEDLPFEHIFGDDLRIIIPMHSDPTAKEILNTLKRIRDYGGLDLNSGEVIRKIKTQQGEKEQRIKMGSAISKMKLTDDDKKRYLDWIARYKDNMGDVMSAPIYTIVLSRAPIDVLRMSDHSGWSSCHSQDGNEFQCAVQEAINGGAIAYVVYTEELNTYLNDHSLQDDEIFSDRGRHGDEKNLIPFSRLRIRRLNSADKEIAIPDTKIYGNNTIPNFYESLKEFLREKQPMSYEEFANEDWKKRGGTYYDNKITTMIQSYYDKEDYPKYIDHDTKDSYSEMDRNQEVKEIFNKLEEECQDIRDNYNRRMKYCDVGYDIEWDNNPYGMPSATAKIEFEYDLNYDNIDISLNDETEVRNCLNGDYNDEIIWSGLLNWISGKAKMKIYSFSFIGNEIEIVFGDEDVFFYSGEYETFCLDVNSFDDEIVDAFEEDVWTAIFEEIGIIPNKENLEQSARLENEGSDLMTFNSSYGDNYVSWDFIVDTKEYKDSKIHDSVNDNDDIIRVGNSFSIMLNNYIEHQYKPTPIPSFTDFFESYYPIKDGHENDVNGFSIELDESHNVTTVSLKMEVERFTSKNVDLFLFMDKGYDDLKNMATLSFISVKDARYGGLYRVYGKFMNR